MGVLVSYAAIVLATLELLGIVSPEIYLVGGIPVFRLVLDNLPTFLTTIAFVVMITRRRTY